MEKTNNGKLGLLFKAMPTIFMLLVFGVGFAGGYTVLRYQVGQNKELIIQNRSLIREIETGYVREKTLNIVLDDIKNRLTRIENKVDRINNKEH